MDNKIIDSIKARLFQIEREHDVKILYSVESGSRAWGFESQDSDYDIRFIYAHKMKRYLNILPKRDVIEYPIVDEFDYSGWDLRKSMFLMNKSNPVLFEWLRSPIVYFKDDYFFNAMTRLSADYFSPISSIYHYLHMASGNYRHYLQSDNVKIKKYFYVLRPVLACMWIEKLKEPPPVQFEKLLTLLTDKDLLLTINDLIDKKKSGMEFGSGPKINIIDNFIDSSLRYFEEAAKTFDPKNKPDQKLLEETFIDILENIEKH